jgi:ribulose 1,5-bisphosphate carboxylase large subunit-like protein
LTGVYDKPLLGGIIKPKVINNIDVLVRMVNEMVEGGVNFIKEDEIMSNPHCCPLKERVKVISRIIEQTNVVYCYCINSDRIEDRVRQVYELGGKGIHINIWSGLGAYKVARDLDFPIFIHFQKSGDRVLTNREHAFHIDWRVICDLAGLIGVDSIHAGMWGGYLDELEVDLKRTLRILHSRNVLPALSCGMHAKLIPLINKKFGVDYMANVGGAIHGHPKGTKAGVMALRQAIDRNYKEEYFEAIR